MSRYQILGAIGEDDLLGRTTCQSRRDQDKGFGGRVAHFVECMMRLLVMLTMLTEFTINQSGAPQRSWEF